MWGRTRRHRDSVEFHPRSIDKAFFLLVLAVCLQINHSLDASATRSACRAALRLLASVVVRIDLSEVVNADAWASTLAAFEAAMELV